MQDQDRQLTNKGVKRLRKAARGLKRLGIPFDGILTSPLLRAKQTAAIVASALACEHCVEELPNLAPGHSVDQLILALARFHDRKHLLLVGHQPLLGELFAALLGSDNRRSESQRLGRGSLACFVLESFDSGAAAELRWFMTAKQLRFMA